MSSEILRFLKMLFFANSNYSTYKDTRNIVSGLVATRVGKIIMFSSKNQSIVTLSRIDAEYVVLSLCAQEANLISLLFEEITEV